MPDNTYTHGHHPSVLRSHAWRTVDNSAAYLVKYIKPMMRILDIGSGPGTLTVSFAKLVPEGHVMGVDFAYPIAGSAASEGTDTLAQARQHAVEQGVHNVTFTHGDIFNLSDVPNGSFDVVHCHQVLQHVSDPVRALCEMRRIAKKGGLIAAREADTRTFAWWPENKEMRTWMEVYRAVAVANGTEPDAGRHLVSWALQAGFERDRIDASVGAWCFSTPEERRWWGGMWAERTVQSTFATNAFDRRLADKEELEKMARGWGEWVESEEGWFALTHGEIVCRV